MPRLRRTAARGRELGHWEAYALITGHDFLKLLDDPLDREAAWLSVRDEWLPEYILLAPGTRPAAWWEFDAPEPRKCVKGPGNSAFRNPRSPEWTRKLWFGAPTVISFDDWKNPSEYESQIEFLNRLDLLEASEVEYIDALAASADPTYHEPEFPFEEWWKRRQREGA